MIHDILLSLLGCNTKTIQIAELMATDSLQFFHPAEQKIFTDILEIANQHRLVQSFILTYSVTKTHQDVRDFKSLVGNESDVVVNELHGLYLKAFCDGVEKTLQDFRDSVLDLEVRYLKKPNFSLLFVYQEIHKFQPLLAFHLHLINSIKTQRLHGCCILHLLQNNSLQGNEALAKAIKVMQNETSTFEEVSMAKAFSRGTLPRTLNIQKSLYMIFINQLTQWLVYGKFIDPHHEFFIQNFIPQLPLKSNQSQTSEKTGSQVTDKSAAATVSDTASVNHEMWHYGICYEMLPHYFRPSWAEKVLLIGQTVLMFNSPPPREDSKRSEDWCIDDKIRFSSLFGGEEQQFISKFDALLNSDNITTAKVEQIVNEIKSCVTKHLSDIAINEADLIKQLRLIKDYFLLGRGELFHEFIKNTNKISIEGENLLRDINQAFRSACTNVNLVNDLEQFNFNIKRDAMESYVDESSQSFINFLTLKYKVKWPLHLIFSPKVLDRYNEMFRFLLKIKKTQFDLQTIWNYQREKKMTKTSKTVQLRNKLMFLIDNLQYYLQADVLESQFSILMNSINNCTDFEHIQRAHTFFQANVLSLCFLLNSSSDQPSGKSTILINFNENPILNILNKILELINQFCKLGKTASHSTTDEESNDDEMKIENMDQSFKSLVDSLLKLFIGLKAGPSNAPLSQLLLRLDFNYWFSSQVQIDELSNDSKSA